MSRSELREGARKTAEHIDAELLAVIRGERKSDLFPDDETIDHSRSRFRQEYSGFPSVADETARERRVHDGGPREVR